ncbi:hypothetical protein [Vibrio hepatarius]|jgi:flagellar biosynthesis/type III secretory pathway M-ring protein FliF/YscJ|uniref:hypothetical protein n=1 Tax=Vibrio hepatarius TaxID=171383 RepID=UPI000B0A3C49|nr:hypothetical protein [Vibrio hepatarius]NIY84111.1 hypothetical protein [Vibrio hepatarius]NVJ58250.1 hypothetical protein [Vibrionaceae bacterium]
MVSVIIFALAIVVFFGCWTAQHGLPVLGMKLDESDQLLLAEVLGEEVLEA